MIVKSNYRADKAKRLRKNGGSLIAELSLMLTKREVAPVSAMPSVWDSPECDEFAPNWEREYRFGNLQQDLCVMIASDGYPASKGKILEWLNSASVAGVTLQGFSWESEFDQNAGTEFLQASGFVPLGNRLESAHALWDWLQDSDNEEDRQQGCDLFREELVLASRVRPHRKTRRRIFR